MRSEGALAPSAQWEVGSGGALAPSAQWEVGSGGAFGAVGSGKWEVRSGFTGWAEGAPWRLRRSEKWEERTMLWQYEIIAN